MLNKLANFAAASDMCENCSIKPKFGGHDYCGRACAAEGAKRKAAIEGQMRREAAALSKLGSNDRNAGSESHLCEVCHKKPKYQERTWATIIEQPYCGNTCKEEYMRGQAAQAQQKRQSGNSMGNSAQPDRTSMKTPSELLRKLDGGNTGAHRVSELFLEKWDDPGKTPIGVQAVYRINQQGKYTERFDETIGMNDDLCQIATCYYGGQILCGSILNMDENAGPCGSKGCSICLAVRFAFEKLESDKTSYDGTYGPGLYANLNPANAHKCATAVSNTTYRVIVQCRVILNMPTQGQTREPFSAITDGTGRVFCQKEAIIPTHLIVYTIKGPGDANSSYVLGTGSTRNRGSS